MRRFSETKQTPGMRVRTTACWPLFMWKDCLACDRDFRRESGWKVKYGEFTFNPHFPLPDVYFVCRDCAPHISDAMRLANVESGNAGVTKSGTWDVNGKGNIIGYDGTLSKPTTSPTGKDMQDVGMSFKIICCADPDLIAGANYAVLKAKAPNDMTDLLVVSSGKINRSGTCDVVYYGDEGDDLVIRVRKFDMDDSIEVWIKADKIIKRKR